MKRAFVLLAVSACGSFGADERIVDGGVEAAPAAERDGGTVPEPPPPVSTSSVRLVQQTRFAVGQNQATVTFRTPVTPGSYVIAVGFWYNGSNAKIASSCVDSFLPGRTPAQSYRIQLFHAQSSTGGDCAITLATTSSSGQVPFGIIAFEYAGLAPSNVLVDEHSQAHDVPGPTPIAPLVMNAEKDGLVFAAFANHEDGAVELAPPLVELAATTGGIRLSIGAVVVPASAKVTPRGAAALPSDEWMAVGASFRAASAP